MRRTLPIKNGSLPRVRRAARRFAPTCAFARSPVALFVNLSCCCRTPFDELDAEIYLPVVLGNLGGAPATSIPVTPTPITPAPVTPTPVTPTPIPPEQFLPNELVATLFNGNAPLTDFYNPQTGEWRDVNGLGQMYIFAADGAYTYSDSGFLQLQNGSCRSEVSTFKQGRATVDGGHGTIV